MSETTSANSADPVPESTSDASDDAYLLSLGVQPRFKRALGFFTGSLFAVAFQGPTTGALLITGATLALGGPAFIWAIPVIFALQLLLAVSWAELSSHYPLTGGIYQWASRLGGDFLGWMTGLFYVFAIVLVMPAVGDVVGVVLSGLFTGLKLTTATEVVISIITTVVAAVIMATSVRVVSILNSIGVVLELAVLLIAAIGLLFHTHQSLSVLGNTGGVAGSGSYLWPFLVVVALVVTQLVGFETAGAFAEETNKARIKPSQAIIAGLGGTALVLFIFDFALLLAIPGVKSAMADPSLIPDVLTAALGSGFAKLFLVGALVAVFSTAIATLATIVRMIYGMARNDQLPGSAFLTKLSGHSREPIGTIIVATVLSVLPLIFIKKIPVIVASITALIIIPYIMVLGSVLWRRLRGWPSERAQFNLGRWGLPITVAGIVWTVVILLDAAWPREITNPKLGPLPVIEDLGIGAIIVGLIWWFVSLRHKRTVRDVTPVPARRQ
ncbi:MAG TPA: APC family permease [Streptosporangiaceae bacterium]|nr:APC family permease [Streptosporangiaceae bacterium]